MKYDLIQIQKAIQNSWSKDTAYFDFLWKKNNNSKASGQCIATALVIQDLLGGELLYSHVVGNEDLDHYWNKIGDLEIDLSSKQFRKNTKFVKSIIVKRSNIEKEDKRAIEVYMKLKEEVMKKLENGNYII